MYENNKSDSSGQSCEELLQRAIRAEENCITIQARLDESQRIANLGSWEWEIDSKHLYWSKETYSIFGLKPGPENQDNYASYVKTLHPEDRNMMRNAVIDAIRAVRPSRTGRVR